MLTKPRHETRLLAQTFAIVLIATPLSCEQSLVYQCGESHGDESTNSPDLAGPGDTLRESILACMSKHGVPGASIAVVAAGKISWVGAFGVVDKSCSDPISIQTPFLAGSISKVITAVCALRLVEMGKISLDEDVNLSLKSWQIPETELTVHEKVTVRRLLSHTAGTTVHGFPGYSRDQSVPTLIEVLDGRPPANTPPVIVDEIPGSRWKYSGGGYAILQQLLIDIADSEFPDIAKLLVFDSIRMEMSSFQQPPSLSLITRVPTGYDVLGNPVHGRFHVYPEMSAAGLWTTATDLALLVISLQDAFHGRDNSVLSQSVVTAMMTPGMNSWGLGVQINGEGTNLSFSHGGRDSGFDAYLLGYLETDQGVVILANRNIDSPFFTEVLQLLLQSP